MLPTLRSSRLELAYVLILPAAIGLVLAGLFEARHLTAAAAGAVNITTLGTAFTQNFDGLPSSGSATWTNDTTIPGWYHARTGTGTTIVADNGANNTGNLYSYGATGSTERALGSVGSSNAAAGNFFWGVRLNNGTASTITSLDVSYVGEQWRNSAAAAQTVAFSYVVGNGLGGALANFQAAGTLVPQLDFTSPITGGAAGLLNGNVAPNKTAISFTITGLNLAPNDEILLRWSDPDHMGSDHGLAIDDFSVTAHTSAPQVGDMQITEYAYSAANGEFVEFTNVGTAAVNMAGWSYSDSGRTANDVSLSAFGIVQPGESVILTETAAATFRTAWNLPASVKVIGGNATANLGRDDEINLYDGTSALIDRLTYGDDMTFPGSIRAQNRSGWAPANQLTAQTTAPWVLSTVNDAQNSRTSTGGDIGNPGVYNTGTAGLQIVESGGSTNVAEGGASDTYSLVLRSQPANDVTVTFNAGAQLTTKVPSLTFTNANWNVPQSVSVSAVDDMVVEGLHTGTITHTVTSGDGNYSGLAAPSVTVTITDNDVACSAGYSLISAVQGSGNASALINQTVTIRGVVVGDYEGAPPALQGFYLQSLPADFDNNPLTSEGIFVFESDSANRVNLGQVVQLTGTVSETNNQTRISTLAVENCGGNVSPVPIDITLPVPEPSGGVPYLERFEGMLVRFHQTLYVTEHFQLGQFGQILMSAGARLPQPTSIVKPGAPAQAQQAANNLNKIIVDDDQDGNDPDPITFGRNGNPLSATPPNTLRGGDTASDIVGVMTFAFSDYHLRPIGAFGGGVPNFLPSNPRPANPPGVGGRLKVVGMNVLNYFLTLDTGGSPCGPAGSKQPCRGANNATELTRQQQKLNAALLKLDADVFGFAELENTQSLMTGQDVNPVADIIGRLNASLGSTVYGYINTGIQGTDTIRVGIAYKTARVTPVGAFMVDNSAIHNRPPLAQVFLEAGTGEKFSFVVNHFKSKSTPCGSGADADQSDGQGCWNGTRTQQASALVSFINGTVIPTAGDPDVLLVGDFNAYAKEDPIRTLETAGFTNVIARFGGSGAYSYLFNGQWGYLDHGLASASMMAQVTNAGDYHINADEPTELDYNTEFKSTTPNGGQVASMFAPDEFRISDHDPVLIGLALAPSPQAGADHYVAQAGTTLTVNAAQGVLFNDTGGPLSIAGSTNTAHGTLTLNPDGSFSYTPNAGFVGTDSFDYVAANAARRYAVRVFSSHVPPMPIGGVNVTFGAFGSALAPSPTEAGVFYGLTDRGPNVDGPGGTKVEPLPTFQPFIVKFTGEGTDLIPIDVILLKAADGSPYNGQVNSQALTGEVITDLNGNLLPASPNGYDPEGLVVLPDGTFWVSDEYGPFITHFDATGTQIERLSPFDATLPAELRNRIVNRGMEGLTITPDGTTLVGIMQSALQQADLPGSVDAKKLTALRIVTYQLAAPHTVHEYLYLLDNPATTDTAVSEITALSNTQFLVDERDAGYRPGAYKKLYLIDITGATDVGPNSPLPGYNGAAGGLIVSGSTIEHLLHNGGTEMDTATSAATLGAKGITPVSKALYLDLGALLDSVDPQGHVFSHDKIEGVAVLNGGATIVVANDSDFGIDGVVGPAPFGLHAKVSPVTGQQDDGELLAIDLVRSSATVTIDVQDTVAPDTLIDSGPSSPNNSTNAGFTFHGTDASGSGIKGFECQLDSQGFVPCTSGVSYSVGDGSHTFAVRAIDNANNPDPTPATYPWVVDTMPPDTFIDGTPTISGGSASFTFHGTDDLGSCAMGCAAANATPVVVAAVVGFQCSLDSAPYTACTSPKSYTGLSAGPHTFDVRAIDGAGNVDPTPAHFGWTVAAIPTAGQSTVVAALASVPADNSTTSTITVTLRDAGGNPVSGKTVTLAQGGGSSTITPASASTNGGGQATFTVKDAVAQAVTYTATDTTDNVTVTQTATVTFTAAGPTAVFVKNDASTQGNWKGVYGSQGAAIVNDALNYPSYAQVTVSTGVTWTWAGTTTDGRALQRAASGRIAACWCNTTFDVHVNLTDGASHQVALYGLDWDNLGRVERVDVLAFGTTTVLDSRTLTGFSGGQYLVWLLSGHVTIRVTLTNGPNAVLSGLFFDPGGSGGPTVVTGAATSIAPTGATLNGTFNPNGVSTSAFFQYGLTTSYTSMTGLAGPVGGTSTVVAAIPVVGLSCNTPYHFRIVGQSTGGTNYGSDSMFMTAPCPGGSSAVFVKSDTSTQGNWKGIYGSDGAAIVNDSLGFPTYAQVTPSTNVTWTWASSTTDGRALQRAAAGRIAACWCASTFNFDVNITDGAAHQVALYALDWDNLGRSERIDILAFGTTTVLDSRTLTGFSGGQYLVWTLSGHVTIRVTVTAGANAVVSGLFFDSDSGPGGPTVVTGAATGITTTGATLAGTVNAHGVLTTAFFQYGSTAAYGNTTIPLMTSSSTPVPITSLVTGLLCGTTYHFRIVGQNSAATDYGADAMFATSPCPGGPTAVFVKSDTTTQGNWKTVYGSQGAAIVNDTLNYPAYAQVTPSTNVTWTWASSTTDARALQRAGTGRIAACWCATTFDFDVNLTDGLAHQVALYALDWDIRGRIERVDILAAGTNTVLDTRTLTGFNGGQYLVWNLSGHVTIRITLTGGPNAVVSGLFFDPTGGGGGASTVTSVSDESGNQQVALAP